MHFGPVYEDAEEVGGGVEGRRQVGVPEADCIGVPLQSRQYADANGLRFSSVSGQSRERQTLGTLPAQALERLGGGVGAAIIDEEEVEALGTVYELEPGLGREALGLVVAGNHEYGGSHGSL